MSLEHNSPFSESFLSRNIRVMGVLLCLDSLFCSTVEMFVRVACLWRCSLDTDFAYVLIKLQLGHMHSSFPIVHKTGGFKGVPDSRIK